MTTLKSPNKYISEKVADFIIDNNPNAASREVLSFSAHVILNNLFTLFLIFLLCYLTDATEEGVIVSVGFISVRLLTGGFHFSSALLCTISSALLLTLAANTTIPYNDYLFGIVCNSFCIIMILFFSNKNLEMGKTKKIKTFLALLIVSSNFFYASNVLATAFLIQGLTLTPWLDKKYTNQEVTK